MTRSRSLLAALLIAGTVLTLAPSIGSAQYFRVWGPGTSYLGNLSPSYGYYSSPNYGYYGSPTFGYYANPTFGYYASPNYAYYVDRNYGYYYSPTYVSPDYAYYGSMYPAYGYGAGDYPTYRSYGYGYYNPGNSLNWNSSPAWGNNTSYSYPRTSDSGYYGGQGMVFGTSGYSGGYPYGTLSEDKKNRAVLNLRLPSADAEVWVGGDKTRSTGLLREFMSPPLDPEKKYSYEIKVRWMENGKEMTRTKKVSVRANAPTTVDFTAGDRDDKDRSGTDKDRPGTNPDRPSSDPDKKLPLPDK
jgi:uncharacterized protein (TIGR03000 family)